MYRFVYRGLSTPPLGFKVSTLSKHGHIEWATIFVPKTAAALRKQMQAHLQAMVESTEYPTLSSNDDPAMLGVATESVRPELPRLMPPRLDA